MKEEKGKILAKIGYGKGEVVFCQCDPYPPWPAYIIEVFSGKKKEESKKEEVFYRVKYYQSTSVSTQTFEKLKPFNENQINEYKKLY